MVSMPHGPVLSQTYDIITTGEPVPPQAPIAWYEYVTEPHDKYSVSAKKANAEIDELSRYELEILGQTFAQFGKMGKWPLVDLTHTLPEWSDPQGSSRPINPEDILRAAGKSDAQIEEWTEMAEEVWFLRNLPSITH